MKSSYVAAMCVVFVLLAQACAVPRAQAVEATGGELPALKNTSVNMPWQELKALMARAKPGDGATPPVDYVFSPAVYSAAAAGKTATVKASCTVTTLNEKWTLVGLGPAVAGLLEVTIDGKPCPLVMKGKALYALLDGKGKKKLEAVLAREITSVAGGKTFSVPLLPSPIVNFALTIPEANQDVRALGASAVKVETKRLATTFSCNLRGGHTTVVTWGPRPPDVAKLPPRIYAETHTLVTVEVGRLRCRATVQYDILRSGVDKLRIALPPGVELLGAEGAAVRQTEIVKDGKTRVLLVRLRGPVRGRHTISVVYEMRLKDGETSPEVLLVSHPDAVQDRGSVGVEVRGGLELTASAKAARRVDVKELPGSLWGRAGSPVILGYKYSAPGARVTLKITKHRDIDVLVAMSDVCEVSTVVTSDGKVITKMMYILRNNQKQFMTLDLPEGAKVWSAFVDDRPVTPVRNAKGEVLIPLKKSEEVDEDDEEDGKTYRARREKRRSKQPGELRQWAQARQLRKRVERDSAPARDLKPYDVEIVFVSSPVKLAAKGDLKLALPKIDIPVGQMAWAVFLPGRLRVVDATGNFKEVRRFSLPFRHFGEAAYIAQQAAQEASKAAQEAAQAAQQAADQAGADIARTARARGVLPVRIEIPITGEIHRFEKFLLDAEAPQMTVTYRKKAE